MSQEPMEEYNSAGKRHWLYGLNSAALAVVGLVVAIIVLAIAYHLDSLTRFTFSFGADNSLTGGTKKVLGEINAKNEKYALISLFIDPSDEQKRSDPNTAREQERRRREMNDLLGRYARFSDKISAEDQGDMSRDEIEKRIRDKYSDELKPYQDAVENFDALGKELAKFLKDSAPAIGASGQQAGMTPEDAQLAAVLQAKFASMPTEIEDVTRMINREKDSTLPRWSVLTDLITSRTEEPQALLTVLSDPKQIDALVEAKQLPKGLAAYFKGEVAKYKTIADKLKAYRDGITKLTPLKVQDVLNGLARNSIVILGDHAAKVIPAFDIYSEKQDPQRGTRNISFLGEQSISSTLYAMAHPNKVKVVFVTASDQRILEDSHSDMKTTLEQNNFEVLAWSPPSPNPNAPPPTDVAPPAEGKGVVWVVFTPDTPSMQMMMMGGGPPNPAALVAATRQHMSRGGQVLFMAEAGAGFMGPAAFPFDELIKDSGIEVLSKYTVIQMQEGVDPETGATIRNPMPYVQLDHFTDTEITEPIQSMPSVFGPMRTQQGQTGMATVVQVKSPLPTGVEAKVLAATSYGADYWGETDLMSGAPKFDKESDYACPPGGIPLAAYSVKNKGDKEKEQRIAVIGSKMMGSNFFLEIAQPVRVNGAVMAVPRFPGNEELMKNTILWLASYDNMIAVSPKSSPIARIDVSDMGYRWVAITLLVLEPLAILGVCLMVLVSRWR